MSTEIAGSSPLPPTELPSGGEQTLDFLRQWITRIAHLTPLLFLTSCDNPKDACWPAATIAIILLVLAAHSPLNLK